MADVDPRVAQRQLLAQRGLGDCDGCGGRVRLADALTAWWRGTIVLVCCEACQEVRQLVATRSPRGMEVRLEDRRLIIPMSQIPAGLPRPAGARRVL